MAMIEVVAKGNFGVHPKHGLIVRGQEYTIKEEEFADQLFERKEASAKNTKRRKK